MAKPLAIRVRMPDMKRFALLGTGGNLVTNKIHAVAYWNEEQQAYAREKIEELRADNPGVEFKLGEL